MIPTKLDDLFNDDEYLKPFKNEIVRRYNAFQDGLKAIDNVCLFIFFFIFF